MNYEIIVSLNGLHLFATHEKSIRYEQELKRIIPILKEKFPKEEGYEIRITRWDRKGKDIDIEEYK